ncbi:MAG TPA: phosphoglycerate mutase family protein [Acidimicrobiales bacterium]|nr:phosphoglycerate mutase family protein [Acidimicrobiales bacterium]
MRVLLVRHGHAGTKEGWRGDDRARPLDARGRRQAEDLAVVLADLGPGRVVTSPYLRCLQTMEPLSAKTGLPIERHDALTPSGPARAVTLVRDLAASGPADPVVLCTHGEVMGVVLATLVAEDGLRLGRRRPGIKGCVWVIDFEGATATQARYIAPRS